jgi:hypothetical protein
MKKLLIIPLLCLVALLVKGSTPSDDFTQWSDSLKNGTTATQDTTNTHNIASKYGKTYKYQVIDYTDTGASFTDSTRVYSVNERGYKTPVPVRLMTNGSSTYTDGFVISSANGTTSWMLLIPNLENIEVVNVNATYTANKKGWYTLHLSNE